jgi:hypothetical protein
MESAGFLETTDFILFLFFYAVGRATVYPDEVVGFLTSYFENFHCNFGGRYW